ncbi:hypothetical protein H6F61_26480 [Cyanobacteria bacterium FACHB-472]|nr:hypothetical protein [Cyanobacteria bacterium FACHB-472]
MPISNPGSVILPTFSAASNVSVALTAATSTSLLAANPNRKFAAIVNNGSVDVTVALGSTATAGAGIVLKGGGGSFEIDSPLYLGAVSAIAASATSVGVVEGT